MLVVFFHYNLVHNLQFLFYASRFGYESVTFFFVLSGFILTYVHLTFNGAVELDLDWKTFFLQRIARIAPAYYIGLALSAPFFVASYAVHYQISTSQFVAGLLLVPTALQAWLPSAATLWNIPAWSLSVEMFLYIAFAPFILITARMAPPKLLLVVLAATFCTAILRICVENGCFIANLGSSFVDSNWRQSFLNYFPLWHLPQFLIGIALGELFLFGPRLISMTHEMLLVIALFVVAAIVTYHGEFHLLSSNIILGPVFGTLIYGAAGAEGPISRIISMRWLVLLGEASYATYIIHSPLLILWDRLVSVDLKIELPPVLAFSAYLLIVLFASIFVYWYVERPVRRYILSCGHVFLTGSASKLSTP